MKKLFALIALFLVINVHQVFCDAAWPQIGGNSMHSFSSSLLVGPQNPLNLKSKFGVTMYTSGSEVPNTFVVSPNYIIRNTLRNLEVYNRDGTEAYRTTYLFETHHLTKDNVLMGNIGAPALSPVYTDRYYLSRLGCAKSGWDDDCTQSVNQLIAYAINSGTELWKHTFTIDAGIFMSSPTLNKEGEIFIMEMGKRGDGTTLLHKLKETVTERTVWSVEIGETRRRYDTHYDCPLQPTLSYNESLVFIGGLGFVAAHDAHTGKRVWNYNVVEQIPNINGQTTNNILQNMIASKDLLVVQAENSYVYFLKPQTGEVITKWSIPMTVKPESRYDKIEPLRISIHQDLQLVYIGGRGSVRVYDFNGNLQWQKFNYTQFLVTWGSLLSDKNGNVYFALEEKRTWNYKVPMLFGFTKTGQQIFAISPDFKAPQISAFDEYGNILIGTSKYIFEVINDNPQTIPAFQEPPPPPTESPASTVPASPQHLLPSGQPDPFAFLRPDQFKIPPIQPLNGGAIAGIVVGVTVPIFLIIIFCVLWRVCCRAMRVSPVVVAYSPLDVSQVSTYSSSGGSPSAPPMVGLDENGNEIPVAGGTADPISPHLMGSTTSNQIDDGDEGGSNVHISINGVPVVIANGSGGGFTINSGGSSGATFSSNNNSSNIGPGSAHWRMMEDQRRRNDEMHRRIQQQNMEQMHRNIEQNNRIIRQSNELHQKNIRDMNNRMHANIAAQNQRTFQSNISNMHNNIMRQNQQMHMNKIHQQNTYRPPPMPTYKPPMM